MDANAMVALLSDLRREMRDAHREMIATAADQAVEKDMEIQRLRAELTEAAAAAAAGSGNKSNGRSNGSKSLSGCYNSSPIAEPYISI